MKHGCKPTKKQAIFIKDHGLNPENWRVVKDTPTEIVLVHKHFDSKTRTIKRDNERK